MEPALAIAEAANRIGNTRRDSCQTGTAVFETRTPVYVARPKPATPEAMPLISPNAPSTPRRPLKTDAAIADGATPDKIQTPTFIGDVGRNTRSMWRNRSGRPKS